MILKTSFLSCVLGFLLLQVFQIFYPNLNNIAASLALPPPRVILIPSLILSACSLKALYNVSAHTGSVQTPFCKHQPCGDRWECLFPFTSAPRSKPNRQRFYLGENSIFEVSRAGAGGGLLSQLYSPLRLVRHADNAAGSQSGCGSSDEEEDKANIILRSCYDHPHWAAASDFTEATLQR